MLNPYHRVDKLGFQPPHANFVHEFPDEGGVLALLRIPHHPKRQRCADKNGDVVARDALLRATRNKEMLTSRKLKEA